MEARVVHISPSEHTLTLTCAVVMQPVGQVHAPRRSEGFGHTAHDCLGTPQLHWIVSAATFAAPSCDVDS